MLASWLLVQYCAVMVLRVSSRARQAALLVRIDKGIVTGTRFASWGALHQDLFAGWKGMEWPVRFHRLPGALRLTDTVLQFLPLDRDATVRIIPLSRVKQVLVSAPGSRVHLLKLQLEDATSAVFEFGGDQRSRDQAREAIARGLRRRGEVVAAAAAARPVDDHDPLYRELVESGLVSEDVYRLYAPYREAASWQARLFQGGTLVEAPAQRAGLPSALLSELRPAEESGRRVKYRFDPATIHQIFVEEPAVQRAYEDTVARGVLDEKSFWKKYVEMRTALSASANGVRPSDAHAAARAFFAKYEQHTRDHSSRSDHENEAAGASQSALPLDVDLRRNEYASQEHREEHLADALELLHRFNRHGQLVMDASHFRPEEQEWLKRSSLILEELVESPASDSSDDNVELDGRACDATVLAAGLLPAPFQIERVAGEAYRAALCALSDANLC